MECSLCLENFQDPRFLPCGHTFCYQCLQKLVESLGNKDLECSLCRKIWQIPDEGLNFLPKNYIADKNILPSNALCILANNGKLHEEAEYFCVDCWDAMCASCSRAHTQTKFTNNHTLKLMKEVTRNDVEQHRKQMATKCANHSNQDIVVYCTTCKEIACTICCVTKHSKHECIELSKADERFMKNINDVLIRGKNAEKDTQLETKKLKHAYENLKKQHITASNQIVSTIAELKQKLSAAYDVVLQRIDVIQTSTINRIEHHLEAEFHNEFKTFSQLENELALHNALCESLLSSSSTVVDRAERMNNVMSQEIKPHKSLLLQIKIEDQIKEIVSAANYEFLFEPSRKETSVMPKITFHRCFEITLNQNSCNTNVCLMSGNMVFPNRQNSVWKIFKNPDNDKILGVHFFKNEILCSFQNDIYVIKFDNGACTKEFINCPSESAILLTDDEIMVSSLDQQATISLKQNRILSRNSISLARGLHAVNNGNILLATNNNIYNTSNKGQSWTKVFKMPKETECYKIVQVKEPPASSAQSTAYAFWVVEKVTFLISDINSERIPEERTEFCVSSYSSFASSKNELRNLTKTVIDNTSRVSKLSHLAWDGNDTVMMSDYHNNAIHMYSVKKKQYVAKLTMPKNLKHPTGLYFATDFNLLFVGSSLADKKCVNVYTYEVSDQTKNNNVIHCFDINIKI